MILSQPFTPSANADIIPLTTSEPADGTKLQITGWGRLKSGGTLPTILQIASVTKMSRTKCSSTWGSVNAITNRMLCAHNSKQASCNVSVLKNFFQQKIKLKLINSKTQI